MGKGCGRKRRTKSGKREFYEESKLNHRDGSLCSLHTVVLTTNWSWFFNNVLENEIESLVDDHAHTKCNLIFNTTLLVCSSTAL